MDSDTLTIGVKSLDEALAGSLKAAKAEGAEATPHFYFPDAQTLFKTLGGSRWDVIEALCGQGPIGVRELARRLNKDVRGVHRDTEALAACGVIDKGDDGKLCLPYKHVVFDGLEIHSSEAA